MAKGLVYILTNPCLDGWRFFTKDGMTLSDLRDVIESEDEED